MRTSTLFKLKKRAGELFEPRLLQNGIVLEVRPWTPSTLIEIDLHLPRVGHWHGGVGIHFPDVIGPFGVGKIGVLFPVFLFQLCQVFCGFFIEAEKVGI